MPRYFLFGFIEVPMWDYYWGLTAAQVELLTIDQPIVVYKADKDNDKPWKKGSVSEGYANKQEISLRSFHCHWREERDLSITLLLKSTPRRAMV